MQKYNHMQDWNLEQAPKSNLLPVPEATSEECILIIDRLGKKMKSIS